MREPTVNEKRLAKKIARDLFTNGSRQRARRLLMIGPHGGDLGGWGEAPMADRIATILSKTRRRTAEQP